MICAGCGQEILLDTTGIGGLHNCLGRPSNTTVESTAAGSGFWTSELTTAHKARMEFIEAMGQAHFSRTDAKWHVQHFQKELQVENARLREEVERLSSALVDAHQRLVTAEARADGAELQVEGMRKVTELALTQIGGWREVIAEWDDMGKTEALAKAMYAAIDQIDEWRKTARTALERVSEKRISECQGCAEGWPMWADGLHHRKPDNLGASVVCLRNRKTEPHEHVWVTVTRCQECGEVR